MKLKRLIIKTENWSVRFNEEMLLYEYSYCSPETYDTLLTHKESSEKTPDTVELVFDELKDIGSEQKFMRNKLSTKNFNCSSLK